MKDYISIILNGQRVGLKFGVQALQDFTKKMETTPCWTTSVVDGVNTNNLTDIGIAHVLYSGYVNNCYCKNALPTISFDYFFDYVEACITNRSLLDENIMPAINCWLSSLSEKIKASGNL